MNDFGRLMKFHRGGRSTASVEESTGITARTVQYVESGNLPLAKTLVVLIRHYDQGDTKISDADKLRLLAAMTDAVPS